MPEQLTSQEVNTQTDPSVAKQFDDETPKAQQFEDLYGICDKLKVSLLGTYRPGVGPVHRAMAVGRREGPDFLFIANNHSQKFKDLNESKECSITFQNSSTEDWVSITGTATTTDSSDPRIKEIYSPGLRAWFGDLGDGKHNGTPEDPRMTLIEVKAKHITYWHTTVTKLGFAAEVATAALTGKVAQTGVQRRLTEEDIQQERKMRRGQ